MDSRFGTIKFLLFICSVRRIVARTLIIPNVYLLLLCSSWMVSETLFLYYWIRHIWNQFFLSLSFLHSSLCNCFCTWIDRGRPASLCSTLSNWLMFLSVWSILIIGSFENSIDKTFVDFFLRNNSIEFWLLYVLLFWLRCAQQLFIEREWQIFVVNGMMEVNGMWWESTKLCIA